MSHATPSSEQWTREISRLEAENAALRAECERLRGAAGQSSDCPIDPIRHLNLDHSLLAVVRWDRDLRVQTWTKRCEEIFGWRFDEVQGKRWGEFEFVYPDDRSEVERIAAQLVEGVIECNTCSNRNLDRSGKVLHCVWFNTAQHDASGRFESLNSLVHDVTDRVLAEQELRRSESRFELAVRGFLIGIWEWNVKTGEMFWSSYVYDRLGYSGQSFEPTVERCLELIHPDDLPHARAIMQNCFSGGDVPEHELRIRHRDGHYLTFRSKGAAELGPDCAPVRVAGCMEDISEIRRVEKVAEEAVTALHESHTRQKLAFDAGAIGTWDYDVTNDVVRIDEQLAQIFRLSPNQSEREISLAEFLSTIHRDDRRMVAELIADTLQEGGKYAVECRVRTAGDEITVDEDSDSPSGRWVSARGTVHRDAQGRPTRLLGAAVDITDRKYAMEELEQTRALLSASIDASPAGIVIADAPDVRIRRLNAAALEILGHANGNEVFGLPYQQHPEHWRCFHPDGTPFRVEELPLCRAIFEGVVSRNVDIIIKRSDGKLRWVLGNAAPVRNADGQIVAAVVVFPDVTEQRRASDAVRKAEAELAHVARVSTMGEMVGGIAHELNQPLFAIQNYAKASMTRIEGGETIDCEQMVQWLEQISDAAEHAGGVLVRLREFVSKRPRPRTEVDLTSAIQAAVDLTHFDARQREVQVLQCLPPSLPAVHADAVQVQQVLVNLIRNAIEAISPDQELRQVEICARTLDNGVQIDVTDSGRGIPASEAVDLYQAFSSTKPQGMGLGLAIAKTIVDSHGGRLWAENVSSMGGAAFHFTLRAIGR